MLKQIFLSTALVMMSAGMALGDSAAVGKAHSAAFEKACAAGDVPAVLALYEDEATLIWPGQGEIANGKDEIKKIVSANCKSTNPPFKLKSQDSKQLASDYIVNIGHWDQTGVGADGKPVTFDIRTTEVIHRSKDKWRYIVDHASIGMPAPPDHAIGDR